MNPLFFLLEVESLFPETREVVSFLGEDDQERIRAFGAIASGYYPLLGRKLPNCYDCGGTIEQSKDYCVCDTCCAISTVIESTGRLPIRVNYNRKSKFRECLSKYQARQDVVIDKGLYEQLRSNLSRYYGVHDFSKVTKKQILSILSKLGKKKQVENIHLIHYEITGVAPKDVRVARLMYDFDVLTSFYDEQSDKGDKRKNFVNARQVLYRLLKKSGVECSREEFGITSKQEKILDTLFDQLGWLSKSPPSSTGDANRDCD